MERQVCSRERRSGRLWRKPTFTCHRILAHHNRISGRRIRISIRFRSGRDANLLSVPNQNTRRKVCRGRLPLVDDDDGRLCLDLPRSSFSAECIKVGKRPSELM